MKLVTGGAYQGKLEYAKRTYQIDDGWIDGRDCEFDEIVRCCGIHHFHEYVRRMLHEQTDPEGGTQEEQDVFLCSAQPGPMQRDPMQEHWRTNGFRFQTDDLRALEEQADAFAAWLYQSNPAIVIVTNELGYGIVPIEKEDRFWREVTGRICTCLAARSDEVVRVVCGIGMRLK
ncbi:MAG: bifunctional adenosylcobinamide kinase/adenosylcobinamide-phosphate guanylyltransferase [Lachnospiraceae bacterium]|nr:bifunctional adenosylcobinamide kinase/adenosylcobinamide-phosphate guanylyltransferase [Lachnospiraceae bacterium]